MAFLCAKKEKMCAKRLFLLMALLAVAAACRLLDNEYAIPLRRNEASARHGRPADGNGADSGGVWNIPPKDTVVWATALAFPDSYDWQLDSAYGFVASRVLLIRDGEVVLDVPDRGNASPDGHHIQDGHLLTEYCEKDHTIFLRDDREYLRTNGRMTLRGCLERDGALWALVSGSVTKGLALYRDGNLLFDDLEGMLAGGYGNPCFAASGALYETGGHVVFCYYRMLEGQTQWYAVEDGVSRPLKGIPESAAVVREVDERIVAVPGDFGTSDWTDMGIWDEGVPVVSGFEGQSCARLGGDAVNRSFDVSLSQNNIYLSGSHCLAVGWSPSGKVTLFREGRMPEVLGDNWTYVFPSCAVLAGSRLFLALTPMDQRSRPRIISDWGVMELDVHGFLTNVSYTTEEK